MTARAVETVISPLLSAPSISGEAARLLLAAVDLAPRTEIPAWITDEAVRADILAGFLDLPDDLRSRP